MGAVLDRVLQTPYHNLGTLFAFAGWGYQTFVKPPDANVNVGVFSITTSSLENEMTTKAAWCTDETMSAWDRVKAAFANDWEQTKADFGSDEARDMNQDVDDTVKQAAGSDDAFENREQAFRFGYAAQRHYRTQYPKWDERLDAQLRDDYDGDYAADRRYIRHAYEYKYPR